MSGLANVSPFLSGNVDKNTFYGDFSLPTHLERGLDVGVAVYTDVEVRLDVVNDQILTYTPADDDRVQIAVIDLQLNNVPEIVTPVPNPSMRPQKIEATLRLNTIFNPYISDQIERLEFKSNLTLDINYNL